jgi:hypothetical protein
LRNHFLKTFKDLRYYPRWKKIRISQTIFSAAILVILIVSLVYFSLPAPTTAKPIAVKLSLTVHPISEQEIYIIVSAVDELGQIDSTRDDTVELSLEGSSSSTLSQSKITLKNGEGRVGIQIFNQQNAFVKARWVSGETPLKDTAMLISPLMWNY